MDETKLIKPKKSQIFSLLIGLVLLLLTFYLVCFIKKPKPLTEYLARTFNIGPNVESLKLARVENFRSPTTGISGTIYHYNEQNVVNTGSLVIDLPGGAFIRSSNTFVPYQSIENFNLPVVSISYPVLFDSTAQASLEYVLDAMRYVIGHYSNQLEVRRHTVMRGRKAKRLLNSKTYDTAVALDVNILGSSAGAYYTVLAVNSGLFHPLITKVILVSGYYGPELTTNQLFRWLHTMYLNKKIFTKDPNMRCQPMNSAIEVHLMSATNDFLLQSTLNYAAISQVEPQIFEGSHSLFWTPTDLEAQRMYKEIGNILLNQSDETKTLNKFNIICNLLPAREQDMPEPRSRKALLKFKRGQTKNDIEDSYQQSKLAHRKLYPQETILENGLSVPWSYNRLSQICQTLHTVEASGK